MDTSDILKTTDNTQRLIQDPEYYKYIFKKTERIVSVVFYITYNLDNDAKNVSQIEDIQKAAQSVHNVVLASLQERAHAAEDSIHATAHALVTLESKLNVAQVSRVIAPEVMQVLAGEIDAVLRGINKYIKSDNTLAEVSDALPMSAAAPSAPKRSAAPRTVSGAKPAATSSGTLDRRERIKTILEATGQASIKDISDVITDCSEKTIQRELNAMIEDNIVKRHGERRWSTYTLF